VTVDKELSDICQYMMENYSDDYECAVGDGNIFKEINEKFF